MCSMVDHHRTMRQPKSRRDDGIQAGVKPLRKGRRIKVPKGRQNTGRGETPATGHIFVYQRRPCRVCNLACVPSPLLSNRIRHFGTVSTVQVEMIPKTRRHDLLRLRAHAYIRARERYFGCTEIQFGCTGLRFGCTEIRFGCTDLHLDCTGVHFGCTEAEYQTVTCKDFSLHRENIYIGTVNES